MNTTEKAGFYRVWGADKVAHGPLDFPTVVRWIKEGRISGDTWVLLEATNHWWKAADLPELKAALPAKASDRVLSTGPNIAPEVMRRIKLFAGLEEIQMEFLLRYMEAVQFQQFSHIVRKGEHADAMYVLLEGEVRALTIVEGKESTLGTMTTGDCFGEMALLDHGPRSVDVIANRDSLLLKLSTASFDRLVRESPALAVPFLLALSRAVVSITRKANKKYEDSIRYIRTAGAARG